MDNSTTPATKADLQAMKDEILKAIGDMSDIMQRQFTFVSEGIDELQTSSEKLGKDFDELCDVVEESLTDSKAIRREFGSRIRRCERRLAIVA